MTIDELVIDARFGFEFKDLDAKKEGLEIRELQLSTAEQEAHAFAQELQRTQAQTQASLSKSYWHLRKILGKNGEGHKK